MSGSTGSTGSNIKGGDETGTAALTATDGGDGIDKQLTLLAKRTDSHICPEMLVQIIEKNIVGLWDTTFSEVEALFTTVEEMFAHISPFFRVSGTSSVSSSNYDKKVQVQKRESTEPAHKRQKNDDKAAGPREEPTDTKSNNYMYSEENKKEVRETLHDVPALV